MTSQGWHPEQIKAAIRSTGVNIYHVADGAGLDPTSLSHCLKRPIPAANRAIADFLGRLLHELWPQWFDADGELLPRPGKPSTPPSASQRKNSDAA